MFFAGKIQTGAGKRAHIAIVGRFELPDFSPNLHLVRLATYTKRYAP